MAEPAAAPIVMATIAIRRNHPAPPEGEADTLRQLASKAIASATIAQHMTPPQAFAAAR